MTTQPVNTSSPCGRISLKIQRHLLMAVALLSAAYFSIASFGQHHSYFGLVGGFMLALLFVSFGRMLSCGSNAPAANPATSGLKAQRSARLARRLAKGLGCTFVLLMACYVSIAAFATHQSYIQMATGIVLALTFALIGYLAGKLDYLETRK